MLSQQHKPDLILSISRNPMTEILKSDIRLVTIHKTKIELRIRTIESSVDSRYQKAGLHEKKMRLYATFPNF